MFSAPLRHLRVLRGAVVWGRLRRFVDAANRGTREKLPKGEQAESITKVTMMDREHDEGAMKAEPVPTDKDAEEVSTTEAEEHRPMTIEEAARKGGNTTKERYGPDFYSRIGRKGGQRVARERGPEFYSEIGRKGGEARVAQSRKLEREPEKEEPSNE